MLRRGGGIGPSPNPDL
uniref:Uncharacterized protein n=1 Tax=Arundo donax TaxID=35708 RepID=A0A0A9H8L6_ARUDO